jgi:hypothetical protein
MREGDRAGFRSVSLSLRSADDNYSNAERANKQVWG